MDWTRIRVSAVGPLVDLAGAFGLSVLLYFRPVGLFLDLGSFLTVPEDMSTTTERGTP